MTERPGRRFASGPKWNFRSARALPTFRPAMPKTLKQLRAMLREAERELDAATGRSALNAAARKLMRAKEALRRLQAETASATRRAGATAGRAQLSR